MDVNKHALFLSCFYEGKEREKRRMGGEGGRETEKDQHASKS